MQEELKDRITDLQSTLEDKKNMINSLTAENATLTKEFSELRDKNEILTEKMSTRIDELNYQNKMLENKLEMLLDTQETRRTAKYSKIEEEFSKISAYKNSIMNVCSTLNVELSNKYEEIKEECVRSKQAQKESKINSLKLQNEELKKDNEKYKEMYNEIQDELVNKYNQTDELLQSLKNSQAKIKMLESENQRLKLNKVDSKILKLQLENETLRAECEKLKTDLILSRERWAKEVNNLHDELKENEKMAKESSIEAKKMAEERDIFNTYIEQRMSKSKKKQPPSKNYSITNLFK
jgi:chromosome segregation ATPase